jgi:hypothetical protein
MLGHNANMIEGERKADIPKTGTQSLKAATGNIIASL